MMRVAQCAQVSIGLQIQTQQIDHLEFNRPLLKTRSLRAQRTTSQSILRSFKQPSPIEAILRIFIGPLGYAAAKGSRKSVHVVGSIIRAPASMWSFRKAPDNSRAGLGLPAPVPHSTSAIRPDALPAVVASPLNSQLRGLAGLFTARRPLG